MGWDRQPPDVVEAPASLVLGRWVVAAAGAVLACVLLFLLYASERVPHLQVLNVWALSGSPLLIWVLAFAARAYVYGGALSHHQFLEEEAQGAQQSWQDWAQRYLAVHGSCVLLPDQVCASLLTQGPRSLPPRTGLARRIAALPAQKEERAQAGLQLLFPALGPALQVLPAEQELRITLLSDVESGKYEALCDAFQQNWANTTRRAPPASVTLVAELSYQWIDEKLKTASTAFELILVLQVHGEAAYSDGLAALLLCPDSLALAWELSVKGGLLRPMPLDINQLKSELPLFLQTQTRARQATGLLADGADWQPLTGKIIAAGGIHGASLKVEQLWIQEFLCGLPGPFSSWLLAALGVEMARHQRRPLVVLTQDASRHWISTVSTGECV
ncbi:hypothetical protein [Pseudomonas fluorescens]|uniref:Type VI secretion protein n=1 Tax=Pseudomonas fluorescens TaxID=294 RepID=A0A5E7FQD6_PSEFL|nr:hypothetical protein [Pseudomonas fluorescens]VVO40497.1 hypothetical protein PS691_05694 [Pseudomonas fluorescens]